MIIQNRTLFHAFTIYDYVDSPIEYVSTFNSLIELGNFRPMKWFPTSFNSVGNDGHIAIETRVSNKSWMMMPISKF